MRSLLFLASICGATEILCPNGCTCTKRSARCDDPELETLEAVQFDGELEKLTLVNNSFIELQDALFKGLPSLANVEVFGQAVTALRPLAFAHMPLVEFIAIESNPMLSYVDQKAFYNLTELTALSLADNVNLFFIDADAFVQCENFQQLDLHRTAILALDSSRFPPGLQFYGVDFDCEQCANANNKECAGHNAQCDDVVVAAVAEPFTFVFELLTLNSARCFFFNDDNTNAQIVNENGSVLSTDGYWEPNPLTREVSGDYLCRLGDIEHVITLNVFPSEHDSWEHYINGEGANLTLSIADFDMSEDLFDDPELHYVNYTTDAPTNAPIVDSTTPVSIDRGSFGDGWFNWITLSVILIIAICLVALLVIMPRIGLYTVLFNLQHVPPKVEQQC